MNASPIAKRQKTSCAASSRTHKKELQKGRKRSWGHKQKSLKSAGEAKTMYNQ